MKGRILKGRRFVLAGSHQFAPDNIPLIPHGCKRTVERVTGLVWAESARADLVPACAKCPQKV